VAIIFFGNSHSGLDGSEAPSCGRGGDGREFVPRFLNSEGACYGIKKWEL
jgi:hypothetical protein